MDPENQPTPREQPSAEPGPELTPAAEPAIISRAAPKPHGLTWLFIGPQGLRAGWSVVLFFTPFVVLIKLLSGNGHQAQPPEFTPSFAFTGELMTFLVLIGVVAVLALLERRRILDYNLRGRRRFTHFLGGIAVGFLALSALVGVLAWGGWLHFGPVALSGAQIFGFGAAWGLVFLLTGFSEEGAFRCYLLYTFTRGLNFWWALAVVAGLCLDLVVTAKGNGVWGVYVIALALVAPCLVLHLKRAPSSGFWQAAWVTSTIFGFLHTSNNGENWIGIFQAAGIGFIFCVSVKLTGSAWWAIGCHAAWDWAETFFYGTADSGMIPKGHFLTTYPAGSVFWSGGTDGPEGSVLGLGALALILLILLVFYRRGSNAPIAVDAAPQWTS